MIIPALLFLVGGKDVVHRNAVNVRASRILCGNQGYILHRRYRLVPDKESDTTFLQTSCDICFGEYMVPQRRENAAGFGRVPFPPEKPDVPAVEEKPSKSENPSGGSGQSSGNGGGHRRMINKSLSKDFLWWGFYYSEKQEILFP